MDLLRPLLVLALIWMTGAFALNPSFYDASCPGLADLVSNQVAGLVSRNPGVAAPLLRLHFHDCFVQGCDGSVLLQSTPGNKAEKDANVNARSLRGFNLIDNIKAAIEQACPGVVSCADTLALVAREAVQQSGGPFIPVDLGRRDSLTSLASLADAALPSYEMSKAELVKNFAAVGLNTQDLVALSGAHTIGRAHCDKVVERIDEADPTLNPSYAAALQRICNATGGGRGGGGGGGGGGAGPAGGKRAGGRTLLVVPGGGKGQNPQGGKRGGSAGGGGGGAGPAGGKDSPGAGKGGNPAGGKGGIPRGAGTGGGNVGANGTAAVQPGRPLNLDFATPVRFDNQYYKNLLANDGLLKSDANLITATDSLALVQSFAANQTAFFEAFVQSFIKMGDNKPLEGQNGQIRTVCGVVNSA